MPKNKIFTCLNDNEWVMICQPSSTAFTITNGGSSEYCVHAQSGPVIDGFYVVIQVIQGAPWILKIDIFLSTL